MIRYPDMAAGWGGSGVQHFIQSTGAVLDDSSRVAMPYRPAPPVLVGAVMVTLVATPAAATAVIVGALGGLHRMWGCIQVRAALLAATLWHQF